MENFHSASLSIASHAFEDLSEFPDSRTFYQEHRGALPTGVKSLLYMATCNRIEIYAEFDGTGSEAGFASLAAYSPVLKNMLQKKPQVFAGGKVLAHLIAVASGLKSLALGETQIAGQIKRDMAHAGERQWLSAAMQTLIQKALETQKKIRTSTGISENSYSLMSLVDNAIEERNLRKIQETMVLVGASEMSAKVARFALRRGVRRFILVRKELNRAMNAGLESLMATNPGKFIQVTLADFKAGSLAETADVMVLASTATEPLFTSAELTHLTRISVLGENAAIVDLSLPANVAGDAAEILGARFISLSSLMEISNDARAERASSAREAEPIIRRAVYQLWLDTLYRENPELVRNYIDDKESRSEDEWQRLASEAALSEKQKRIMYDFMKKEQRRALQQHREMILDLIAGADATPSL